MCFCCRESASGAGESPGGPLPFVAVFLLAFDRFAVGEISNSVITINRQIAEQEKKTYATQKEAQDERRALENATAQAAMQPKVVESERNVEIQKNVAEGKVKEAEGSKAAAILQATGEAEAIKLRANAQAEATKVTAGANAEATSKLGNAEAEVILAKGRSNA